MWTVGRCIVYTGMSAAAAYSSLYFAFFFLSNFYTWKCFVTLFLGTVRPRRLKLVIHVENGRLYRVYLNHAAALIHPFIFSFFFLSSFQTKIFVTLFSGNVRPRKLKLGTHVDSGQMYRVYLNEAATYLSLYFFIFLCNFLTLKLFVNFCSGTVRPRRLKLGTPVDSGQMYGVYRNQAAAAYLSLYFSFFFLSNFQTLKIFLSLFSGTVRPRRLKLGTHVESGQMYHVYQNQAAAASLFLYFFYFLSLQFSNVEIFRHTFLRNCEA